MGWGRPGPWPTPPCLEIACVLWHQWTRNSIWEIDFPCGDLTSCFTGRGDQTVLGGVSEQALWKVFPLYFFFLSFLSIRFKGDVWLCWRLHTTSLGPRGLELWDIHTNIPDSHSHSPPPPLPDLRPPHRCCVLDCRRFSSIDVPGLIQNPFGILGLGMNTPFPSLGSIFTDPLCKNLI